MFVITEWLERYEVNASGQPAKHGDKLRAGPLLYIRSKVYGHAQSSGFYAMQQLAGPRAYEVFGVFQKFLEISGDSGARTRGILLNNRGEAATESDLSRSLRVDLEIVEHALQVLINKDVGWVQEFDSVKFTEFKEFKENWDSFLNTTQRNETKRNTTQHNETKRNETQSEGISDVQEKQVPETLGGYRGVFDGSQSDSVSTRFDASTRFAFANKLREMLAPKNNSDLAALRNLQDWAGRLANGEEVYRRLLDIAKDSKHGRNPIAVFFSRVADELGYRARAETDKQKQ